MIRRTAWHEARCIFTGWLLEAAMAMCPKDAAGYVHILMETKLFAEEQAEDAWSTLPKASRDKLKKEGIDFSQ